MKVSIVMGYYNRKQQLLNTLASFELSAIKDIEVVITDDGSSLNESLDDIVNNYNFPIELIKVNPKDKTWMNPCVAYNKAINVASGDIIIIQNPECMHCGDIIKYVVDNLKDNEYYAFSCYNLEKAMHNLICNSDICLADKIANLWKYKPQVTIDGWYNHPTIRPCNYHFTSAITKSNLTKLNGFDERFAYGLAFDDNEFLCRVIRLGLSVKTISDDTCFAYHQNHDMLWKNYNPRAEAHKRNCALFNQIKQETGYVAKRLF